MSTVQRQAQAFYLSSGVTSAGTTVQLTATAALPLLIDDILVSHNAANYATSTVSRLTLSGQSVMCSSQNMTLSAFHPFAKIEGQRSLGLTIDSNQQLMMECVLTPAASTDFPVNLAASTSPTDVVIGVNNAPSSLINYCFGMGDNGGVAIAAGASVTLSATSLRDGVFLGRLVGDFKFGDGHPHKGGEPLTITSILCDGIELLSAQSPASAGLSYDVVSPDAADKNGLQANYVLSQNSIVKITVKNNSPAHTANISMGFFCRPLG
jgi:hypothetical protein